MKSVLTILLTMGLLLAGCTSTPSDRIDQCKAVMEEAHRDAHVTCELHQYSLALPSKTDPIDCTCYVSRLSRGCWLNENEAYDCDQNIEWFVEAVTLMEGTKQ